MCHHLRNLVMFGCVLSLVLTSVAGADLIGYWPVDGDPADRSGNGYDGVVEGGVTYGDGALALAADFNGSDALINCEDVPVGETGAITIAFWVKPRNIAQNWAGYVSKWTLDNGQRTFWLGQHATDGWLRFGIYPGGPTAETFVDSGQVILAHEQWTHIACTHDGNVQKIYADGVEVVASPPRNAGVIDRGGALRFGKVASANWLNGLIDDVQIYDEALPEAEIQAAMQGISAQQASSPAPADEGTDVSREVILSWTPGEFANTHDVYFGAGFDDVNDASRDNPLSVLISQGQEASDVDAGRVEFGQTYYWRVDEVNGTPDFTVFKGDLWSFTAEPIAVPIIPVSATASSAQVGSEAKNTINGSGLTGDLHGTISTDMWLSLAIPATIEYAFDRAYKLHELWIWNSNQSIEAFIGFGAKDVVVEHSLDGATWTILDGVGPLAQAPGILGYAHNNTIDFGGAVAQHVRVTVNSVQGFAPVVSLSEVRFYAIPTLATRPDPAEGATDVAPDTALAWGRNGREADHHDVYIGTDANDLASAGSTGESRFATDALDLLLGQTYSWRIDEVNDSMDPSTWTGEVWRFTTADTLLVDDMERYKDEELLEPWATWVDGFDDPSNGALIGNGATGSPETGIVHGGGQSLPLYYNNVGAAQSEATQTFVPPMDWTGHGVQSLSLYFHGASANSGGQLYVKINHSKVLYGGDAADITGSLWQPWIVDLSTVGENLQNVTSLTIGVEGGATGVVYIDDIRLYPLTPAYVTPVEPDKTRLVAHYALDGDATDDSGNAVHGVANGDPTYEAGVEGQAIRLDGIDDFLDLGVPANWPSGAAPRTLTAWAQTFSTQPGWRVIAGYGSPAGGQATALVMNGTSLYGSGYGSDISTGSFWETEEWRHVGLTYDGATVRLYADGVEVASGARAWNTTIAVARIGRQVNEAPEFWDGRVDDVRLYNQAISLAEMAWLAGKRTPVAKPF